MAKLNGVNVVSEKITYNGVEYVKTDADAKVGDIIREDHGYSFMPKGEFYEAVDRNGKPVVYDEDGDYYDANSGQVTVFAKVEAPAAADTVVHNGVTYRKVARKAKEGDKFVIANVNESDLRKGAVYAVNEVDRDGDVNVSDDVGDRHYLINDEFTVLEPLASAPSAPTTAKLPSTLPENYVIHEGAVYRKESRKAEVGEKVEVSGHPRDYANGIFTVRKTEPSGHILYDNYGRLPGGYAVLVPTDTVTIGGVEYTLEKRKADVGDTVLVVAAEQAAGNYANGTISTIESESWEEPAINGRFLYRREYVVLVPKANASTAPQYREVKRKANVGERIRIVAAGLTGGRYRNGDELTVSRLESRGVYVKEHGIIVLNEEYVVLEEAKPEPVAAAKPDRLKVGDYAKVVGNGGSCYEIGDIVKISEVDVSDDYMPHKAEGITSKGSDNSGWDWFRAGQLVRATDAEVAAARKQAEEAAETAKWAKIGRKVGEFKAGDIVKAKRALGDGEVIYGKVEHARQDTEKRLGIRTADNEHYYSVYSEGAELIAPVESLFTAN